MPIPGADNRLQGLLTDRDIVVKCIAEGSNPAGMTAGQFSQGKLVTIGSNDSIEQALKTMSDHKVRRLPVIEGDDLVGMLAQADIARHLDGSRRGHLVQDISQPGPSVGDDAVPLSPQPPSPEISGGRHGGTES